MGRRPPPTFRGRWVRVTRRNPCSICGKPDWCTVSADGRTACCARVASDRRLGEAGWAHDLGLGAHPLPPAPPPDPTELHLEDLEALQDRFLAASADRPREFGELAAELGVSEKALEHLGMGWSRKHGAWTFPMVDHRRRLRGFRLRLPTGRKLSVKGGHEGLFFPWVPPPAEEFRGFRLDLLVIVEGPTDCAAALDLGLMAIGRPSCSGGLPLILRLVREDKPRSVAIIADADGPGRRGAARLAAELSPYCPDVRVAEPPAPHKDLRAWYRAGAIKGDVVEAINDAPCWHTRIARSA